MPAALTAAVLADPVSELVDLVAERDPGGGRAPIAEFVETVPAAGPSSGAWPKRCWTGHRCWPTDGPQPHARSVTCSPRCARLVRIWWPRRSAPGAARRCALSNA